MRQLPLSKKDKARIRAYVLYAHTYRNGRNVRIMRDEAVKITIDGNGSQMRHGIDYSGGTIFVGWARDLLACADVIGL